ncbi:MAG: hypothetical protein PHT07_00105 [Paludibacter sp.]|nr:hypothetical protein [Paludibacter sp.]
MDLIEEEEKKDFLKNNKKNVIIPKHLSNTSKLILGIPITSTTSSEQYHEIEFYNLDKKFTFGEYKGKSVREVIDLNPKYLDWCAIHIDYFYITDEAIEEILNINSGLIFNENREILHDKYLRWKEKNHQ